MSDIPEDIMRAAKAIASNIPSRVSDVNRTFAASVIARAILAERERCARIVQKWGQDDECIQPMFGLLAAAIRSPERAGE